MSTVGLEFSVEFLSQTLSNCLPRLVVFERYAYSWLIIVFYGFERVVKIIRILMKK